MYYTIYEVKVCSINNPKHISVHFMHLHDIDLKYDEYEYVYFYIC